MKKILLGIVVLLAVTSIGFCQQAAEERAVIEKVFYPTVPGNYRIGDYEYSYEIVSKGTRSESRIGILKYKGEVVKGEPGEIIDTPFGRFMHFSEITSKEDSYSFGWLNTLPYNSKVFDENGKPLVTPIAHH